MEGGGEGKLRGFGLNVCGGEGEGEGTHFGLSSAFLSFPHGTDNQKGIDGCFRLHPTDFWTLQMNVIVFSEGLLLHQNFGCREQ